MGMGIIAHRDGSRTILVALTGLLLATATACAASNDTDQVPTDRAHSSSGIAATGQPSDRNRPVDVDAITATSTGLLVAGHRPHGESSRVWQCPALTALSQCRSVGFPRLAGSEYVDDMDTFGRSTYWVLTTDVDRARGHVYVTTNGGRSWVQQDAPSHGMAAGSWGAIHAFNDHQAVLIQYTANGPVGEQYQTDDAGASWQTLGRLDLN